MNAPGRAAARRDPGVTDDRATVVRFEIAYRQVLGAHGTPTGPLPEFARDPAVLIRLYRAMVLARAFDTRAIALQRTGRIGTYASSLGQEAVAVGVADAMEASDVFLPSFREHGGQLLRGVSALELLLSWGGDERGADFAGPRHDFPNSVPVGSHALHAAGAALALKLKGGGRVAVCVLGDGATSRGDFYEALNVAGVWTLPALFVITNNQWAISVPRARQSAAQTLAQKAIAAGLPGEQVDGNDVIAVRAAAAEAIGRARGGGGASLIEALTYRLADHTTADDSRRYRDRDEVSRHWELEPIGRLRRYLVAREVWTKADEKELIASAAAALDAAVEAYEGTAPQPPEAIFDDLFATLPRPLEGERAALLAAAEDRA